MPNSNGPPTRRRQDTISALPADRNFIMSLLYDRAPDLYKGIRRTQQRVRDFPDPVTRLAQTVLPENPLENADPAPALHAFAQFGRTGRMGRTLVRNALARLIVPEAETVQAAELAASSNKMKSVNQYLAQRRTPFAAGLEPPPTRTTPVREYTTERAGRGVDVTGERVSPPEQLTVDQAKAAGVHGPVPYPTPPYRFTRTGPRAEVLDPVPKGFTAYHGSPHAFDKFSISKIGTGEGAQAYGHGLYLAGKEATAKAYRDALKPGKGAAANDVAARVLEATKGDYGKAIKEMERRIHLSNGGNEEMHGALKALQEGRSLEGHMYEVNVKADPEHFLDWDKPLSQQPKVIEKLTPENMGLTLREHNGTFGYVNAANRPIGMMQKGGTAESFRKNWTTHIQRGDVAGSDLYRNAGLSPHETTEAFRKAGIPGIRYLDQGSRTAGEGSHNFVVFDDATIDILRKYGLAGLAGGAVAGGLQTQTK